MRSASRLLPVILLLSCINKDEYVSIGSRATFNSQGRRNEETQLALSAAKNVGLFCLAALTITVTAPGPPVGPGTNAMISCFGFIPNSPSSFWQFVLCIYNVFLTCPKSVIPSHMSCVWAGNCLRWIVEVDNNSSRPFFGSPNVVT